MLLERHGNATDPSLRHRTELLDKSVVARSFYRLRARSIVDKERFTFDFGAPQRRC
jgi:hypothetical protein